MLSTMCFRFTAILGDVEQTVQYLQVMRTDLRGDGGVVYKVLCTQVSTGEETTAVLKTGPAVKVQAEVGTAWLVGKRTCIPGLHSEHPLCGDVCPCAG
jgi:hypothetical protein